MALKRKQQTDEPIEILETLTEYTVTRAPSGFGGTGLPPASPREASPEAPEEPAPASSPAPYPRTPRADLHVVRERRDDPRCAIALEVIAEHPGGETLTGVTENVSACGIAMRMPAQPSGMHEDLVVADAFGSASLWVQIVSYDEASDGGWVWHVKITAADDGWDPLVDRARDRNAGVVDVRIDDDHAGAVA